MWQLRRVVYVISIQKWLIDVHNIGSIRVEETLWCRPNSINTRISYFRKALKIYYSFSLGIKYLSSSDIKKLMVSICWLDIIKVLQAVLLDLFLHCWLAETFEKKLLSASISNLFEIYDTESSCLFRELHCHNWSLSNYSFFFVRQNNFYYEYCMPVAFLQTFLLFETIIFIV